MRSLREVFRPSLEPAFRRCYNYPMNPAAPHPDLRAYLDHHWPAYLDLLHQMVLINSFTLNPRGVNRLGELTAERFAELGFEAEACLLYTSPSPRDRTRSRMPSSA